MWRPLYKIGCFDTDTLALALLTNGDERWRTRAHAAHMIHTGIKMACVSCDYIHSGPITIATQRFDISECVNECAPDYPPKMCWMVWTPSVNTVSVRVRCFFIRFCFWESELWAEILFDKPLRITSLSVKKFFVYFGFEIFFLIFKCNTFLLLPFRKKNNNQQSFPNLWSFFCNFNNDSNLWCNFKVEMWIF